MGKAEGLGGGPRGHRKGDDGTGSLGLQCCVAGACGGHFGAGWREWTLPWGQAAKSAPQKAVPPGRAWAGSQLGCLGASWDQPGPPAQALGAAWAGTEQCPSENPGEAARGGVSPLLEDQEPAEFTTCRAEVPKSNRFRVLSWERHSGGWEGWKGLASGAAGRSADTATPGGSRPEISPGAGGADAGSAAAPSLGAAPSLRTGPGVPGLSSAPPAPPGPLARR